MVGTSSSFSDEDDDGNGRVRRKRRAMASRSFCSSCTKDRWTSDMSAGFGGKSLAVSISLMSCNVTFLTAVASKSELMEMKEKHFNVSTIFYMLYYHNE